MTLPSLESFSLVGGTALALRYGHRSSIDLDLFSYEKFDSLMLEEDLKLQCSADIAAMKIQAILGRGRKKDFWDLFELLQYYSLEQIINWHRQKYPGQHLMISIPNAITYFVDADESEAPVSFKNQTWEDVKKGIQKAVRDFLA